MKRPAKLAAIAALLLSLSATSHAELIRYQTILSPEAPGASGTGFATADYDSIAHTLAISALWSGLSGTTSVAHIHCCTAAPNSGTAGVAVTPGTLPGFPTGLTSGSYSIVLDLLAAATYTTGFVNGFAGGVVADAEEALIAGFNAHSAYLNIHTSAFPSGEIRGFLAVPEPAGLTLMLLGLCGLAWTRRRAGLARAGAIA